MPLSDKDRELWRMAMKDVKPLASQQLPESSTLSHTPKKPAPPKHTWDLHGMTLSQAHEFTLSQVYSHKHTWKFMTFITGKSGQMNQEFSAWLARDPHVKKVDPTNDGGAFRVWFKKTRHNKK